MSKLDDLFGKKKEVVPVLDLSKTIANTKDEIKRVLEKVPDYKMRAIKVRPEDIKIKEKDSTFKTPKKEVKLLIKNNGERERLYTYLDPIPIEMRSIVIMDLCPVPIDWRMLTTLRPKAKMEEEYFSKLVELGKLQLKTEIRDKRENTLAANIRKVKNKSGVIETRIYTCPECSEEFCNGKTCCDFNYDLYTRTIPKQLLKQKQEMTQTTLAANKLITGITGINDKNNKKNDSKKHNQIGKKKLIKKSSVSRSKSPIKKRGN